MLQLLLGIKDTDDNIVASTLVCLSELVPLLGADTVIGGKRTKLFTDGRPKTIHPGKHEISIKIKSLKDFACSEEIFHINDTINFDKTLILRERPSPVGGESIEEEHKVNIQSNKDKQVNKLDDSEDEWDDWDNANRQLVMTEDERTYTNEDIDTSSSTTNKTSIMQEAALQAKKNILDITELDIKNQKVDHSKRNAGDEFDFFADMVPVIEKPKLVNVNTTPEISKDFSNKLNFVPDDEMEQNEAWGESWND